MNTQRPANGILIERARELRMITADMISDDCIVKLDDDQYRTLTPALDRIEALGDIDFVLHACVDHRPGHHVRWTNGGSPEQDVAVDQIMNTLISDLGFVADLKEPAI